MPHSFGYRAHTRTLFKKAYKTNGRCPTTTYLRTFKVILILLNKSISKFNNFLLKFPWLIILERRLC